jgi:hypothetical protein
MEGTLEQAESDPVLPDRARRSDAVSELHRRELVAALTLFAREQLFHFLSLRAARLAVRVRGSWAGE